MNKLASIKIAVRKKLISHPNNSVTLTRPVSNVVKIKFSGKDWGAMYQFSEFDDNGDPSTEEEYDQIYSAIETIVNEHNSGS